MRTSPTGDGESHSNHVENRLTLLEADTDQLHSLQHKVHQRLSRLERMGILIIGALHALAHDKLPEWAKSLSSVVKLLTT